MEEIYKKEGSRRQKDIRLTIFHRFEDKDMRLVQEGF
jgi:hypothetical protein